VEKELELFDKRLSSKDGYRSECKACRSKEKKEWYKNNSESVRKRTRKWSREHPEKKKMMNRQYHKEHPPDKDKARAAMANYRKRHPEKTREGPRKWRLENPDKSKASMRNWRSNNPEKAKEATKNWRQKHPENNKATKHNRRMRERNSGKLAAATIQMVYEDNIKKFGTLTCYLCMRPVPFGKDHLEHKIPLSRGGNNDYDNLAIACQRCNCSKQNKTLEEVLRERE
jgi:5-methylcytosine-specific restriction endonuclease McrA